MTVGVVISPSRPINVTGAMEAECCSFSSRIPGVVDSLSTIFRDAYLPGLLTIEVNDNDAMAAARQLIAAGFPVGPSSGLNYVAAVEAARRLDQPDVQIVTVLPDRMERYFTTELFRSMRGDGN